MPALSLRAKLVLAVLVLLFLTLVWPTAYEYGGRTSYGVQTRRNRFTGKVEFWHGSWR